MSEVLPENYFVVDRYFLGIKPADSTTLPKKHQHAFLKSKDRQGTGLEGAWSQDNKYIAQPLLKYHFFRKFRDM